MDRQRRGHRPVIVYTPTSSSEKEEKTRIKGKQGPSLQRPITTNSHDEPAMNIGDKLVSEVPNRLFIKSRMSTFCNWPFKGKNDVCTVRKMVISGFLCTGTTEEPSSAECVFCGKEMIFDATDDPWEEHKSHCPECPFVKLDKTDEHLWSMQDVTNLSVACMGVIAANILKEDNENVKNSALELVAMVNKKL